MKKLLILLLFIFLYSKIFTEIKFTGDVDTITKEFDRTTLLKVSPRPKAGAWGRGKNL